MRYQASTALTLLALVSCDAASTPREKSPIQQDTIPLAAPAQLTTTDGKPIDTRGDMTYAGPLVGDIDGDGRDDLLVTTIRGIFRHYRNTSAAGQPPTYTYEGHLQGAGGKDLKLHNW